MYKSKAQFLCFSFRFQERIPLDSGEKIFLQIRLPFEIFFID